LRGSSGMILEPDECRHFDKEQLKRIETHSHLLRLCKVGAAGVQPRVICFPMLPPAHVAHRDSPGSGVSLLDVDYSTSLYWRSWWYRWKYIKYEYKISGMRYKCKVTSLGYQNVKITL
jgi:hypothetical protein